METITTSNGMLQQLISNYKDFGDALITEFRYNSNYDYYNPEIKRIDEVEVVISCFNKNRNYERDLIRILCKDIIYYSFHQIEGMIFQALIKNKNGVIILDFFPELHSNPNGDGVISKESLNSDCIVKCKEVGYKILG